MHPAERLRGTKSARLQGKTIVLGVTGSIAAVETVRLAHELIRHGADVHAVMSHAAASILHPNALQFATGHPVVTEITGSMEYLEMCGREGMANLLLIAPATANTIGKVAHGIDDTTVTTYAATALGTGIPILMAPAAHETMIDNPAAAPNVRRLRELGVGFVEPRREEDKAKMADIDAIVAHTIRLLGPNDLAGLRVLVVAGATAEPIDDVRVVTNRSTGGTGIELARTAFERGADVELWMGRHEAAIPAWLAYKSFETTADLVKMAEGASTDITIVPAAISDFSPRRRKGKIPSREGGLTLDLEPTPKVLELFRKGTRKALVGYKAESRVSEADLRSRALALLKEANLDLVVANDVSRLREDATAITIFDRKGEWESFAGSKGLAAERVWRAVLHGVRG